MGAILAGEPFDLDPTQVSWDYEVHIADRPYIGGKVVQVFGAHIGDITVTGSFSEGSWESQNAFLARMKRLGSLLVDNPKAAPHRFTWPEQGWDFQVYLKEYSSPDGSKAVVYSPRNFAPKWKLVLFPVEGSGTLKAATVTSYIDRLARGMGWGLTQYNGALTLSEAQRAMASVGATNVEDFFSSAFGAGGIPSNPSNTQTTTSSGQNFPTGRSLTVDEMVEVCYRAGFRGNDIAIAVAIARAESGWNPSVVNNNPNTQDYSVGLFQINMLFHKTNFGTEEELKVPERNANAALALRNTSQGWRHWSVYKNGKYQQYLGDAQAAVARKGY